MSLREIVVLPYDPSWPQRFAEEQALILAALAGIDVRLHHIGSTAVPGLAAKPILDLLLEVADLAELDRRAAALQALGYQAMGEYGIPGRRYFHKGGPQRSHQLHAFQTGSAHAQRHLAFRDYLRRRPDVAAAYGALKQQAAAACDNDIDRYCAGKDAFVKHHEALALQS